MSLHHPTVAIVGATGAVGAELIGCLERRAFPMERLRLLASGRSAGRKLLFHGQGIAVEELNEDSFAGVDIALFSAGSTVSRRFAPMAVRQGAVVVDNSSAFRMEPGVPLVVPEVNPDAVARHIGIIANPNCVAIVAVMALWPLHRHVPICRVIAATYQAASGAGAAAMQELRDSTAAYLAGSEYQRRVLAHPYAFNLFSHDTKVDPVSGYNEEETKVMRELRKIMDEPDLRVGITCVRVPVLRAHSMALTVEFERPVTPNEARHALAEAPGVRIVDDVAGNHFPMPNEASGQDDVLVGRIRVDASDPSGRSLALFVAGDQLLKGAALNAVQIAERLVA
jgi:aspartate-semialdehyde dehydrogenase